MKHYCPSCNRLEEGPPPGGTQICGRCGGKLTVMKDDGSLTTESTQQQSGFQPAERLFTSPFEWLRYYYSSILGVVGFFSYALVEFQA